MMLLTLPGIAFMVGTADLLIPTLLGKQWSGASPLFAVLGLASFIQILNNPTGWLFISQNRTREYMLWGVVASVTCIISFVVGLPYGPIGVAVAYAAGEYIRTPILWWYVTRRGPIRSSEIIRLGLPHFIGVLASLAAVGCVRAVLPAVPTLILGVSLVASFAASLSVIAALPLGRSTISQTIGLVSNRFQRARPL
jgi:polysaccharide transporter, PST family